jgi:hypothetical protein
MRQLSAHNTLARLLSTAGIWGEIQIVSTSETIVLDIQVHNDDPTGHLHRDHAVAPLSVVTAIRLHILLSEAIEAALDYEPHQLGLWSDVRLRATERVG